MSARRIGTGRPRAGELRASLVRATCVMATLLALDLSAPAAAAEDGGAQGPFARGAGNRALALGGAYTSLADDAGALSWNPAGLALMPRRQLLVSQASLFGVSAAEQHLAFGWPNWRLGTFAFSVRRLGVSDIERTDDRNTVLGSFSAQDLQFALGYARDLGDHWHIGASFKLRRQELADFSGNGFGLDLGVTGRPFAAAGVEGWASRVQAGLGVRNAVAPSLRLDQESVAEPTAVAFGASFRQPAFAGGHVILSTDVEKPQEVDADFRAGIEVSPHPLLALRGGWNGNEATAGAGVKWKLFAFDYAFENVELEAVHRFGVSLEYGPTAEESRLAAQRAEEEEFEVRLAERFERKLAQQVDDLVAEAESLLNVAQVDEAQQVLTSLKALAPDDARLVDLEGRALFAQAEVREQREEFAEAAIFYGRVLAIHPDDERAQERLDHCRAESNLRAERSSRIRTLFAEAQDLFASDDLLAARARLRDILTLSPSDEEAADMLARTEFAIEVRRSAVLTQAGRAIERGLLDEATDRVNEARRLEAPAAQLASLEQQIRDAEDALQRAARAAQRAREQQTLARAESENPAKVVKAPTLSRKKRKEIADLYRKGMDAIEEDRADDALRYWELVWLADPNYENVSDFLKREYLLRGLEEFSSGELDEAIRLWEKAQAVDPEDEKTLGYLARAREQRTRTREILGE